MRLFHQLSESMNFLRSFSNRLRLWHIGCLKAMTPSSQPANYLYLDDDVAVFSVAAFICQNGLPDDARLRAVICEEIRKLMPGIRILEETN